jgi:prepilin-type N-terminal cleavage/methylation domain-containing protein
MRRGCARGFTLIDVLVSIAVIAVLIGILLPSLGRARETARRVICSSNVRQIGLGLAMFADDHKGRLPSSRFSSADSHESPAFHKMNTVRVHEAQDGGWDGLGILYYNDYLPASGVFYCPSHFGEHPYSRYADLWPADLASIVANYQFRGLPQISSSRDGARIALTTDGLSTQTDYSHRTGSNILRGDLSVVWFDDPRGSLLDILPVSQADAGADEKVASAWEAIDALLPDFSPSLVPNQAGIVR